jgi:hypothetical protein
MRILRNVARTGVFALGLLAVVSAYARAEGLSGQVRQDTVSYPGAITKSMTMTPGPGTFSADHLRFGRQVAITLYNPNPYAMRFDTVQRIGKEYSWVVPANSYRTVAFRYFNPVSDEVRFLSYQDPDSLLVTQGTVTQRPAAVAVEESTEKVEEAQENTQITPAQPQAQEPMKTESKSAVRGYW